MIRLEQDGRQLLYVSIIFMIFSTIAVVLRLIAKQKTKSRFAIDDTYIILALIGFAIWNAIIISNNAGTYDPSKFTNPIQQFSKLFKLIWVAELFLIWGATLVKVSVLAFYGAIFTTPSFRFARRIVLATCLMWCIATTAALIFQCRPIKAAWDPQRFTKYQCILFGDLFLGCQVSNVAIDIAILGLPIYMIQRLNLPAKQRWTLGFIFLLGGFVCITGILTAVYSYNPKVPLTVPSVSLSIMWDTIGSGTAIICACLPLYRPLLREPILPAPIRIWFASATDSARRQQFSSTKQEVSRNTDRYVETGYRIFRNDAHSGNRHLNDTEMEQWTENIPVAQKYPVKAITVESRVEVV